MPRHAMLMFGKTWFGVRSQMSNGKVLFPELLQQNDYVMFGTGKFGQFLALSCVIHAQSFGLLIQCHRRQHNLSLCSINNSDIRSTHFQTHKIEFLSQACHMSVNIWGSTVVSSA